MSSKQKQINNDTEEKKKARMPPRMHLSTTPSHMNNIMPNDTIDTSGLNPAIEMPWLGGATHHPRTSMIKFVTEKYP